MSLNLNLSMSCGLLAISAVTLFVTQAWEHLRGLPLFFITFFLFVLGLAFTYQFLQKKMPLPAGIMATFSLALVPLAIYNLQYVLGLIPPAQFDYSDYHYWVNWYWVPMEFATLFVGVSTGLSLLRFYDDFCCHEMVTY